MNTTRNLRHALVAATLLVVGGAHAENFNQAVYKGAKDDVKATYKVDRERCNGLSGNAKDICVESAKGQEKVALAMLEFNYTGNAKDEAKVYEAQYEANYDVAKEKCDDLGGKEKDVCVQAAKTERDNAKADLKLAKTVSSAADTAVAEKMKADYKLAREKCETLAGNAKDVCVASAKARYHERW